MSEELFNWIKRVSLLTDEALREEIQQIHQSSVKAFTRALSKSQDLLRHILYKMTNWNYNQSFKSHWWTSNSVYQCRDTCEPSTLWYQSSHGFKHKNQSADSTNHCSFIRGKVSTPIHLQIRQFIGQDLAALEDCFDTQQEFSAYTLHHFKWNLSMCLIYICYYSEVSSQSFHSLESEGEQLNQQDSSTQMIISESLNELNLT